MSPRLALAAALLSLIAPIARAEPAKTMVVTPLAQADFRPISASPPYGAAIAVLRGDPASGPSTMLLRMPKGPGQLHVHTHDYELVVVQGEMKHWSAGQSEADSPVLGPGGYWFQPGGQAHADSCLSDQCLMVVTWSGPRDGRLADPLR